MGNVEDHVRNGRKKLPRTRRSLTHKIDLPEFEGYVTIGFYDDDQPCEVFIYCNMVFRSKTLPER